MKFEELIAESKRWLGHVDREAVAIVCATVLSPRSPGNLLWVFLVGPSGVGKTTLLEAIPKKSFAIAVSSVTSRSFVSGAYQDDHVDLLPKLKGLCLVVHDFSSVLAKPFHEREAIFTILRECYDNRPISVRFGSIGEKKFSPVRFSFIAGCTSALDAYKSVSDALGQRNLILRLRSNDEAVQNAQDTLGHEDESTRALAKAFRVFLRERTASCRRDVVIRPMTRIVDRRWAQALAWARCPVSRDRQHHIQFRPDPEVATRLVKQFGELRRLGAIILDVPPDDDQVTALVRRLARDSIPTERLELLEILSSTIISTGKLVERLRLPKSSVAEWLVDLWVLRIANRSQVNKEDIWAISESFHEKAADLLTMAEDANTTAPLPAKEIPAEVTRPKPTARRRRP